jgi:hypothetical protein
MIQSYNASFYFICRSENAENDHFYENTNSEEPLYENCTDSVIDDDKEHIYEHVSCQSPVNIFFGLLQSDTETISPDPNIYEVPPGAIFNSNFVSFEEPDAERVKPPKGFQDYENVYWDPQTGFDEEIFSLPVEVIYSTVVKPKRRKCRPHLSAMLYEDKNAALKNVEVSTATDVDSSNMNGACGCSGTGNVEQPADSAGYETSSEHGSRHIGDSGNDVTSSGNIIDYTIDGSVVCHEEHSNDTKPDDNRDILHKVNLCNALTSSGENSVDGKVISCVNPVEEATKVNDEDKTIIAETDNRVTTCGSNVDGVNLDKCVSNSKDNLIDTKIDERLNCSRDAEKPTEVRTCINAYENTSVTARVGNFVTSSEDISNDIDVQDKTVACKDESIANVLASGEDNAIYNNIDKCLSFPGDLTDHSENNATIIISGKNADSGGIAEERISISNEILDSVNGEFPKSTVISGDNVDNESENKISNIPQIDCTNIEEAENEEASVIEISEDGTWETKTVPHTELSQVRQEDRNHSGEEPEFLCAVDRLVESVKTIYGSQYYVNCPVASVKPMKHESTSVGGNSMPRNIGAQIMEKYSGKKQKLRETLPDVSLLDVDASLEDIERERRRIIENQTVRAKKINCWVRNGMNSEDATDGSNEMEDVSSVGGKTVEVPSPTVPAVVVTVDRPEDVTEFSTSCVDVETCTSDDTPKLPAEGKFSESL